MKKFVGILLASCLAIVGRLALAEDIDLFVGVPVSASDRPNVMIVLDNAANFTANAAGATCVIDGVATKLSGTVGGIEQCALYKVISEIETSDPDKPAVKSLINLGMMIYNQNNLTDIDIKNCGGSVGGCLVLPLVELTEANKDKILAWIKTWKTNEKDKDGFLISASSQATGAAMQETWAYFAGRTGLSGRDYSSVKPHAGCQKNYVIFVGNSFAPSGTPGDQTGNKGPKDPLLGLLKGDDANKNAFPVALDAETKLIRDTVNTTCGGGTGFTFPESAHETKGYYADEWSRYMASRHNITTYTVGVLGDKCQAEYEALLSSMATYGNGNYYATTTYTGLVLAFEAILSEIQSVNSVFASVSLPVSVNTQGTYLNQVFIGMFRPDADALPRWAGNLKQYRMGMLNGALQLLDANEEEPTAAISGSGTGFIAECARSYWTPTEDDEYWANFKRRNCQGRPAISNTPDGNIVEKGGQGYRLRGSPTATTISRTVTTCSPKLASCTELTDFSTENTTDIKQSVLDPTIGATNRAELINWAIGLNNNGDEDFVAETAMRASAHGDVVHSRPVALNFGTEDLPNVVVFYGANDGMLRAINGNRKAAIGSIPAGGEIWSFMAPEFYGKIKRLRDNATAINFPTLSPEGKLPKPYGFDGPITAYKDDENAWIYATMRRGGRAVYAFNVDVDDPTNISLKWKRGCDDSGCSAGMIEIGQTWSTPQILRSSGYEAGAQPMIIMGGGYDACEDVDDGTVNNACTPSSNGNRIYVLDAEDGTLLNDPDNPLITERGVVGNVTIVPDENGLAKYAYAADLGGNVYRINIGSSPPDEWTLTKIASLGCDDPTVECKANRKFLFGPDVIEEGGTTYLLLGSGDREKPLTSYEATTKVENRFYMIKDKPNESTWLTSEKDNCGLSVICEASLTPITADSDPLQSVLDESKGWYLTMRASEQVVTSPITIYGVVTFSTHQPAVIPDGACSSNLGEAWVYNVRYLNAASANGTALRYQPIAGDGLPPSPVAGLVTLDDVDGKKTVPFVIGASPDSPLQVVPPPAPPPGTVGIQPKSRVYWYIQQ